MLRALRGRRFASVAKLLPSFFYDNLVRDSRKRKMSSLPLFELSERHISKCRVLPDRLALLKHLEQGGVAAEIGVAYGDFSEQILKFNKPRQLHLIDLWEGRRYGKGLQIIREKFATEIDREQVTIAQGYSTDVLAAYPNAFFDWVYIDTSHSYETTAQELALAEKKVKLGGIISGHDFSKGNTVKPVVYGVIQACHEFCVTRDYEYLFITLEPTGDFSFALQKLS